MTNIPLLEHDPNDDAVLHPQRVLTRHHDMPEHVVFCFFQEVIADVAKKHPADIDVKLRNSLASEIGPNPIHGVQTPWGRVAVVHPGVGAALAAGFFEEVIALGGHKFMACGGAGVLSSAYDVGHVVIPQAAIRDEGTSYHYLPPSREVTMQPQVVDTLVQTLEANGVPYDIGKTWTTDAIYRETRGKVIKRREEGCLVVEMETAAFLAVAQFRDVPFGQLLYGGDDVSGEAWDSRSWRDTTARERLFWLAAEAVFKL